MQQVGALIEFEKQPVSQFNASRFQGVALIDHEKSFLVGFWLGCSLG
jgi:hypothetical protein